MKYGPATAHEGDTVTYTFAVTNTGNAPFYDGYVEDNIAGTGIYQMGDTNNNGYLDPGETWMFTVEYDIPTGQTANVVNTVTACGYTYFDLGEADTSALFGKSALALDGKSEDEGPAGTCDTDTHTLDVLHPGVKVVKSGPANAVLGSTGTYTFTVTNTGDAVVNVTEVADNIAGAGTYVSGDTNANGKLDLTETWVYQATYHFTSLGSVENTVTVCAEDSLEMESCDADTHKTIVYQPQVLAAVTPPPAPQLQDTGTSLIWQSVVSLGLVVLATWTMLKKTARETTAAPVRMYSSMHR